MVTVQVNSLRIAGLEDEVRRALRRSPAPAPWRASGRTRDDLPSAARLSPDISPPPQSGERCWRRSRCPRAGSGPPLVNRQGRWQAVFERRALPALRQLCSDLDALIWSRSRADSGPQSAAELDIDKRIVSRLAGSGRRAARWLSWLDAGALGPADDYEAGRAIRLLDAPGR